MDTIEGTWRFAGQWRGMTPGNSRPSPYEGHGMGRIVIGGGRMAVMMIDWRHDVPSGQKREYSGYTGRTRTTASSLLPRSMRRRIRAGSAQNNLGGYGSRMG